MEAWHFLDGEWTQGNPAIMGPMDHASWLASTVFDGARAFEGVAPDLDRHCERVVSSALAMGLEPTRPAGEILEIAREGIGRLAKLERARSRILASQWSSPAASSCADMASACCLKSVAAWFTLASLYATSRACSSSQP